MRIIAADGIPLMDAAVDGQFTENDTTHNHRLQGTGVLAAAHFGAGIWCPGDDVLIQKADGIRSSNLLIKVLRNSWRYSISVVRAGLKLSLPRALSDATESSPD